MLKSCATTGCGRPVPPQPGRGAARRYCEVCSPSRSRLRAAAAAARPARTDVADALDAALDDRVVDTPAARLLAAIARALADDIDDNTGRPRTDAVRVLLGVADRLDALTAAAPGHPHPG